VGRGGSTSVANNTNRSAPTPDRAILALKFVAATSLDETVSSWRRAGPDRPEYTQLRWGRIFDRDEIGAGPGGDRRGD